MSSNQCHNEKLARAVAKDLSAARLPVSIIARYDPLPEIELKDLECPLVTVRDAAERMVGFANRSESEHEYDVEVAIRSRIDCEESVFLSRLKLLGQQIADFFRFQTPTGVVERLKRIDNQVVPLPETLDQQRVRQIYDDASVSRLQIGLTLMAYVGIDGALFFEFATDWTEIKKAIDVGFNCEQNAVEIKSRASTWKGYLPGLKDAELTFGYLVSRGEDPVLAELRTMLLTGRSVVKCRVMDGPMVAGAQGIELYAMMTSDNLNQALEDGATAEFTLKPAYVEVDGVPEDPAVIEIEEE